MSQAAAALGARQIVESAWRDQAIWSKTASALKADVAKWRFRALIAGVVGAALETLAGTLAGSQDWKWLSASVALAGAVILAVIPYVARTKASKEREREWVRACAPTPASRSSTRATTCTTCGIRSRGTSRSRARRKLDRPVRCERGLDSA